MFEVMLGIVGILLVLLIGKFIMDIRYEIRQWNGGVCPQTGGSWMYAGTDKHGYDCFTSGINTLTVHWNFILKKIKQ